MKVIDKLLIKFSTNDNYEDPSPELLEQLMRDVNEHFSVYQRIFNPEISGNWVIFEHEFSDISCEADRIYMQGIVAGYLMAKGFYIR